MSIYTLIACLALYQVVSGQLLWQYTDAWETVDSLDISFPYGLGHAGYVISSSWYDECNTQVIPVESTGVAEWKFTTKNGYSMVSATSRFGNTAVGAAVTRTPTGQPIAKDAFKKLKEGVSKQVRPKDVLPATQPYYCTIYKWKSSSVSPTPDWTYKVLGNGSTECFCGFVRVSKDGSTIAAIVETNIFGTGVLTLYVWKSGSSSPIRTFSIPNTPGYNAFAGKLLSTPDGRYLTFSANLKIWIYDTVAGKLVYISPVYYETPYSFDVASVANTVPAYIAWSWTFLTVQKWVPSQSTYVTVYNITTPKNYYADVLAMEASGKYLTVGYDFIDTSSIMFQTYTTSSSSPVWTYISEKDPPNSFQDTPTSISIDNGFIAVSSWGDSNNWNPPPTNPQVMVFTPVSNQTIWSLRTSGSMTFVVVQSIDSNNAYLVASGYIQHANYDFVGSRISAYKISRTNNNSSNNSDNSDMTPPLVVADGKMKHRE